MTFANWVSWFAPVNNQQRLVSPQGPYAGVLSNLAPHNSSLNKQMFGLVGTQKSITGQNYTEAADLALLATSGWDVIANPIPPGASFTSRLGRTPSSHAVTHGDNY